jgi:hypothetical protein
MRIPRSVVVTLASLAIVSSFAASARADSDLMFGARVGYYADAARPFVGGELLFKLAPSMYFNPNLEVVFKDDSYFTFNADFHYDFPHHGHTSVWLGAGLGVVSINPEGPEESHTDAGLDILLGIAAVHRKVVPYVQAKAIVMHNSEFAVAFGVRF